MTLVIALNKKEYTIVMAETRVHFLEPIFGDWNEDDHHKIRRFGNSLFSGTGAVELLDLIEEKLQIVGEISESFDWKIWYNELFSEISTKKAKMDEDIGYNPLSLLFSTNDGEKTKLTVTTDHWGYKFQTCENCAIILPPSNLIPSQTTEYVKNLNNELNGCEHIDENINIMTKYFMEIAQNSETCSENIDTVISFKNSCIIYQNLIFSDKWFIPNQPECRISPSNENHEVKIPLSEFIEILELPLTEFIGKLV